jgi:hypothetical protein
MQNTEHENLLRSARSLLDRFMFEGDELRDDVPPQPAEGSVPAPIEKRVNVAV